MNKILSSLMLLCGGVILTSQELPKNIQYSVTSGAQGKEFWIAIPPNEINPFPQDNLEVYVTSAFDTEVEVWDVAGDRIYKRKIGAGQVRTLSDSRGETNWTWEVRETEQVVKKGIRLRADKPISVAVLNSKVTTSDGYLALPTSNWDTHYIATTYYDFKEYKPWPGGFMVVAGENGTEVKIVLKGSGELDGRTSGGKKINTGDTIMVTMDEGDVYMVQGDGQTRGLFDLTGSSITSNVPVGVLSYHIRTTMPNILVNGNGRNHLVEMNIPVSQWDTVYATIEYKREHLNGQGMGDVFRVIASEPNTKWKLKYYDLKTKQLLGEGGGVLVKAGDVADLVQSQAPVTITHGFSVWTADKPIQVVQLSCSSSFDGDPILDPFQINLLPTSRYIYGSVFQMPTASKFTKHRLNLIVKADTADPDYIDNLKSLTIDNKPAWNHPQADSSSLLVNRIPGTDLHWCRIDFGTEANSHFVATNGKISFTGYMYGFGEFDAYGWPLGPLHVNIQAADTSKPSVSVVSRAIGEWTVDVAENVNVPSEVRPSPSPTDQVDAGIAVVGFADVPDNLELEVVTAPGETRTEARSAQYAVKVKDLNLAASGRFYALDYKGNVTYQQFTFSPKLGASPDSLVFGMVRVGRSLTKTTILKNRSSFPVTIAGVSFGTNVYKCENAMPVTINAGESFDLRISAKPMEVGLLADTANLSTSDGATRIALRAIGVVPQIEISQLKNFPNAVVGEQTCPSNVLVVQNIGYDTAIITRVKIVELDSPFSLTTTGCTQLPHRLVSTKLQSLAKYSINCLCYQFEAEGNYSATLRVETDDPNIFDEFVVNVATTGATGVSEEPGNKKFSAEVLTESINLSWDESLDPTFCNVIDVRGNTVHSSTLNAGITNYSISTARLSAGLYIVQLQNATGAVSTTCMVGVR